MAQTEGGKKSELPQKKKILYALLSDNPQITNTIQKSQNKLHGLYITAMSAPKKFIRKGHNDIKNQKVHIKFIVCKLQYMQKLYAIYFLLLYKN